MKKTLFIPFILILFIACSSQNSNKLEEAKHNTLTDNSSLVDTNFTEEKGCNFGEFIKNPKTPKLAKDIYLNKEWNLENDIESLALLDSLDSKDAKSRLFYFKIITIISKKSDGYFSEAMGLAGKEFTKNYTEEFLINFDNKDCFSENDLENWTKIVSNEFKIIEDKEQQKEAVSTYISELKENCKDCSEIRLEIMSKFIHLLNENF